jgi:hypothetical protein
MHRTSLRTSCGNSRGFVRLAAGLGNFEQVLQALQLLTMELYKTVQDLIAAFCEL